MKSVFYRPTGKLIVGKNWRSQLKEAEKSIHPCCIVRNNEIYAPEFLEDMDIQGKSIFHRGDVSSTPDLRLNAVGDTQDQATGYQIQTDTLTYIIKEITRQSFYLENVGAHIPIRIGEGAFSRALLTNRTYSLADDPESGFVRDGGGEQRISMVDVAVDGVTTYIANWIKGVAYSLIDVEQALRANNWDLISELHMARKTNWDLLVQKIAMLGSATDTRMPGLLTNPNINTISGIITGPVSGSTAAQFATILQDLIAAYWTNTNSTALPNTWVIPYTDYIGLVNMVPNVIGTGTGTYPVSMIDFLEMSFKAAVKAKEAEFNIVPSSYCDATNNPAGLHYYMLYRNDARSIRMNIPVDYTVTQAGTINNLQFQDAAYGQITGVTVLKNLEVVRMTY
jgi:hypothetical protein